MKELDKLELLRSYLKGVKIPLEFAVGFNSHKCPYFPELGHVPTSLWKSQIPTFEDFVKDSEDPRYDWRLKKSFHMIELNGK